jgi:hypothetical protein
MMRSPSTLARAALFVAGLTACGASPASGHATVAGCAKEPAEFSPSVAPRSGATLKVKVGALVYVALVRGKPDSSWLPGERPPPTVFPWTAARSSNRAVLRPVAVCPSRYRTSPPVRLYAFRAVRPGTATLTAPVATAWTRYKPARRRVLMTVAPYRSTVTVQD